MKVSQTLYTTNYKFTIEQHDGLIMNENILILLSCIYVQKYDYMNNNYFLCPFVHAFTLNIRSLKIRNDNGDLNLVPINCL
jgi:hypothetical protein